MREEIGERLAGPPADPDAAAATAGTWSVRDELVGYLEELERRTPGGMVGVPTGFQDLDLLTGGLQDGTLIVVAGPTAAGISTFGLTLARMAAIRAAVPTLVFSLDLTGGQVIHRLLCAEGPIDSQRLLLGRLDERDWVRLTRVLSRVAFAPLLIDASPTVTVRPSRPPAGSFVSGSAWVGDHRRDRLRRGAASRRPGPAGAPSGVG